MHTRFAVKAVEQAQTYWNLLEKVEPKELKLTKYDDEIFDHLMATFPELNAEPYEKLTKIDEDWMKSPEGKTRWRDFIERWVVKSNFRSEWMGRKVDGHSTEWEDLVRLGCSYERSNPSRSVDHSSSPKPSSLLVKSLKTMLIRPFYPQLQGEGQGLQLWLTHPHRLARRVRRV